MLRNIVHDRAYRRELPRRIYRFSRGLASPLAKRHFYTALMMLPVSRAFLMNRLSPFAPALFAAGLAAGLDPYAMLGGCAFSALAGGLRAQNVAGLIGALGAFGVSLLLRLIKGVRPEQRKSRDLRIALCAFCGALLPGLALSAGLRQNLLAATVSALTAAALGPCLYPAMLLRPDRTRLLPDELLAVGIYWATAILGSARLPSFWRHLPLCTACLGVLAASTCGAGGGAVAGVAAGCALRLCGVHPALCALLSLCGTCAGVFGRLRPWAGAGGMVLSMALISAWTYGPKGILAPCLCAALAGTIYCLLPQSLLQLLTLPSAEEAQKNEEQVLERQRQDLARQLTSLSGIFADLAEGYGDRTPSLPEESVMISRLREGLCEGCSRYSACWCDGEQGASRLLCQLLGMAFSGAREQDYASLPPHISRQCRRASQIARRIGPILTEFNEKRLSQIKRGRLTCLMSAQFHQTQQLLAQAAQEIRKGGQADAHLASVARSALEKEGLRWECLYAMSAPDQEICASIAAPSADQDALRRAARHIAEEVGEEFLCSVSARNVRFLRAPRCRFQAGCKSVPGSRERPSGDSRAAMRLQDGRILLALADGMGSGESALQESRETLRLVIRFLQAGIEPEEAMNAINELLLLRSGEDIYSTLDLCVVEASGRSAGFYKLGACRSYLLRESAVIRIEGGLLPLGILEDTRPVRRQIPLCPGDLLVMATDGLAGEEEDEWVTRLLLRMHDAEPQQICDALIAAAVENRSHADDATALAMRIA